MHPLIQRCCSHAGRGSLVLRAVTQQSARSKPTHGLLPLWLTRRNHDTAVTAFDRSDWVSRNPGIPKADAIVVGGGPAGIAAVGNLLEQLPRGKIVWIDRSFEAGNLRLYGDVPSYSSVADFLQYARALETFKTICDAAPQPNAVTALEELPLGATCVMRYPTDMLQMITDALLKHERVESIVGEVTKASRNYKSKQWLVGVQPPQIGFEQTVLLRQAPIVVYCIGSRPETEIFPMGVRSVTRLSLETGLAPTRLAKLFPPDQARTVAVVGDGHSAVLTLRNLFRMASVTHPRMRIRWFTPTANLKYAEYASDGVLRHENTGLKGEAARFARTQLEGDLITSSDAGAFITRIILPTNTRDSVQQALERDAIYREHLDGVRHVFQAIGWTRSRLPLTQPGLAPVAGPVGKPRKMMFNSLTGSFFPRSEGPEHVLGLFGAGIGFPEMELTATGRQPAVGILKFMSFLKRAVPKWIEAMNRGVINKQLDPPEKEIRFRGVHRVAVGRMHDKPQEGDRVLEEEVPLRRDQMEEETKQEDMKREELK